MLVNRDFDSRVRNKKAGLWDEMILKVNKHFAQGPYNQLGGSQKDRSSHWRLWWGADPSSDFMLASLDDTGFQNGVYFQSREADLFLEENN